MSGLRSDSFQRALIHFKQTLNTRSPGLVREFSISSLQDIQEYCLKLQDEMGQSGGLRRMRRLKSFIEAMDELGKSIDVFVNANDLVCFIWGPIKFLLGVARTYTESLDRLLDAYEEIGDAIPGLLAYRSMLEKHPPLAHVLHDYYSDVLRFHEAALAVFTAPKWKTFFKSAWKKFDTEFQPVIQSLTRRRQLLDTEKGSASLYEISKSRQELAAWRDERKREVLLENLEKHKQRLLHIKEKLEAADYQQDQELATEARNGVKTGDWLSQTPAFQKWTDMTTTGHGILYVHGMPGAGKTTIVSSIIESLLNDTCNSNGNDNTLVAYFYVKHKQPEKDKHNSILRAIMEQMLTRDTVLSDHLFDELASVQGVTLRSNKNLESLIATNLESYQRSFIVIDGLDEAAPGEAKKSLNWLLSLVNGGLKEPKVSVRILFSGQRDGNLDHILSDQPSIPLESYPEHEKDIRRYCIRLVDQIHQKFGNSITSTMKDEIISRVVGQAKGMFLYARVVLENLLNQTRVSRLKQEMEPATFPDGLDRAYERVAKWVLEDAPEAERQDGSKIIGWITCAARPLYWREIQSTFCIDEKTGTIDYEGERLRVPCKQLCGALVDVHNVKHKQSGPDDIVTFVHGTAREYLLRRRLVDIALEHAKAATFCFRYLTSEPFLLGTDHDAIESHARQGYYGFQHYAVQHALGHFEQCTELHSVSAPDGCVSQHTMQAAGRFLAEYGLPNSSPREKFTHQEIIDFVITLPLDRRERADKFTTGYRTLVIRRHIEQIRLQDLSPSDKEIVNNVYGLRVIYKCPKVWCDYFSNGFDEEKHRMRHVQCHERPFSCPTEGCFAFEFGFDTQGKMNVHMNEHHQPPQEEFRFPRIEKERKAKNDKLLLDAAHRGDFAAVSAFLESGPVTEESFRRSTRHWKLDFDPLYQAAKEGHIEVCKLLLARGVSLNWYHRALGPSFQWRKARGGIAPMRIAVEKGFSDMVHVFITSPTLPPATENSFMLEFDRWIYKACQLGHLEIVKLLVECPKTREIHIRSKRTESRFWWQRVITECWNNYPAIVKYLLENGFSQGVTPDVLFLAEKYGLETTVSLLKPIVNLPDFSQRRTEAFLRYEGIDHALLETELFEAFRNKSPQDQRETLAQWRNSSHPPPEKTGGFDQILQDCQAGLMLPTQEMKDKAIMEVWKRKRLRVTSEDEMKSFYWNVVEAQISPPALRDYQIQLMLLEQEQWEKTTYLGSETR